MDLPGFTNHDGLNRLRHEMNADLVAWKHGTKQSILDTAGQLAGQRAFADLRFYLESLEPADVQFVMDHTDSARVGSIAWAVFKEMIACGLVLWNEEFQPGDAVIVTHRQQIDSTSWFEISGEYGTVIGTYENISAEDCKMLHLQTPSGWRVVLDRHKRRNRQLAHCQQFFIPPWALRSY